MIVKVEEKCEKDDFILSVSFVRLQFVLCNFYIYKVLNFIFKINVQYKIQYRQLRVSYLDVYYCVVQLKYLKEMFVELRDLVVLFFCDDKVKVFIGEFKVLVFIGVRGKVIIVFVNLILCVLDYDMIKVFLIFFVYFKCDIFELVVQFFV